MGPFWWKKWSPNVLPNLRFRVLKIGGGGGKILGLLLGSKKKVLGESSDQNGNLKSDMSQVIDQADWGETSRWH